MTISFPLVHVEDDDSIRRMVAMFLATRGVVVHSCASISEAKALSIDFEVALLDNHLPDGLGVEYGVELRRRHPHLTIVLCTAVPNMRLPHGVFDGYLPKPFKMNQLFEVLTEAKEKRERDRQRDLLQARLLELRQRRELIQKT